MYTYRITDNKGNLLMNVQADDMYKAEDAYYHATGWVRVVFAEKL